MADSEEWPPRLFRLADKEHLHALGQLTLSYNFLEDIIGDLFTVYAPTSHNFAVDWYLGLNNRRRIDILREMVEHKETDPAIKAAVLAGLYAFDICTDNRNILAHSLMEVREAEVPLRLIKRKSKNSREFVHFEVPLGDLRRAADEIATTYMFVVDLYMHITDRDITARGETFDWRPTPLPEIPLRPRRLTPYQPAGAAEGA